MDKREDSEQRGFQIEPKKDCPHFRAQHYENVRQELEKCQKQFFELACKSCKNIGENWICLECVQVFCSRYVKGHMMLHNEETKHPIALSFSDASFWCYDCESYIINQDLLRVQMLFS